MINEGIFRAYDIRGIYPTEINEESAYKIARAFAAWLKPKKVALGRDVRISGKSLMDEVKRGLADSGVNVVDIGVITTDMLYFAVANYGFDGGISITASHNPAEYNGMKLVREDSIPISIESGLAEIRNLAKGEEFLENGGKGTVEHLDMLDDYLEKLLSFFDKSKIRPMKVVVNPNFGAAGKVIDRLASELSLDLVKVNFEENGTFPKGRPDPLQPENRDETSQLIKSTAADFGVAWDADADRCFWFTEEGEFIPGYYEVSLLAEIALEKYPRGKVVYDPRLYWATQETIKKSGGEAIISKVGHSFIKEKMREVGAVFGGEMSGHFYFKDFFYCDNGMIPFLMLLQKLSSTNQKLSEVVKPFEEQYPSSEEFMFKVKDAGEILSKLRQKYADGAQNDLDGLDISYSDWRFSVRPSNTEPVIKMNLEAKTKKLVDEKVKEISDLIK